MEYCERCEYYNEDENCNKKKLMYFPTGTMCWGFKFKPKEKVKDGVRIVSSEWIKKFDKIINYIKVFHDADHYHIDLYHLYNILVELKDELK